MKNTILGFGWDTAVVLFLLAIECGRAVELFSVEGLVMGTAMVMLIALPYFLMPLPEVAFGRWVGSRALIAIAGVGAGTMLPASMQFMPMTMLIIAALVSCYLRFYGLMRLRPVK